MNNILVLLCYKILYIAFQLNFAIHHNNGLVLFQKHWFYQKSGLIENPKTNSFIIFAVASNVSILSRDIIDWIIKTRVVLITKRLLKIWMFICWPRCSDKLWKQILKDLTLEIIYNWVIFFFVEKNMRKVQLQKCSQNVWILCKFA